MDNLASRLQRVIKSVVSTDLVVRGDRLGNTFVKALYNALGPTEYCVFLDCSVVPE